MSATAAWQQEAHPLPSLPLVVLQAVHEMNRQTGANVDPNKDPAELMEGGTRGLMSAVHQLPALVERKRTIEKHSTLLHKLLKVRTWCPTSSFCTHTIEKQSTLLHKLLEVCMCNACVAAKMECKLYLMALLSSVASASLSSCDVHASAHAVQWHELLGCLGAGDLSAGPGQAVPGGGGDAQQQAHPACPHAAAPGVCTVPVM